ncbi:MAG: glycosyltransferase [Bryobacteraceae bacterium]
MSIPWRAAFLLAAAIPFIYYCLAIFSSWRFFRQARRARSVDFTPPVSILKPIRGVDPGAYENFASFCRQDYPEYEIVFCVSGHDDPVAPLIERLQREFPERRIVLLYGSGRIAANDKVAKLARMVEEARHEYVVINDSDVRAQPGYLRTVVGPLRDARIGATTCFYTGIEETSFTDSVQAIGMLSDFYAGILVAWQLDGVKFALGPTIATTRAHLSGFGGYAALENRTADDLLVGRLIAEQGLEVKLLPYRVDAVADYQSMRELIHKRLRWIVVMRHMRPLGHLGLLFTQGLPWSLAAIAIHPSVAVAAAYLVTYFALRCAMTWMIGVHGLKQRSAWRRMPLIPVWDALSFGIWVASFLRRSIRWRGADYFIGEGGALAPAGD